MGIGVLSGIVIAAAAMLVWRMNTSQASDLGGAELLAAAPAQSLLDTIDRFLLIAAIVGMALTMSWKVVGRYVLEVRAPWADELGRLLLVWGVFLGAVSLERADAHIRMPLLYDKVSGKIALVFRVVRQVISAIILGALAFHSLRAAWQARNVSLLSLPVPTTAFVSAVSVAAVGMLIVGLWRIKQEAAEPSTDTGVAGVSPTGTTDETVC